MRHWGGAAPLALACVLVLPSAARAQQQQAKTDAPVFDAKAAAHIRDEYLADLDTVPWAYFAAQLKAADPAQLTGKDKPWGMTIDAAAFGMTGDLHEHLGQLIAYSRSVGVKPPWTQVVTV